MNRASFAGFTVVALACLMFAAFDWYLVRQQTSGGWFSAYGDPLTILPALGFALLGISVPFLLKGSGKFKLPIFKNRALLLLVPSAILVAVSTGWILVGELVTPAALWWDNYGFPLPWRVEVMRGCPPWCNLPSSEIIFNPFSLVVDCLFYLAIGYAVILYRKRIGREIASVLGVLPAAREFVKQHDLLSRKTVSATMISLVCLTAFQIALFSTAGASSSCGSGCQPHGLLSLDTFRANSPTNMTLKVKNTGNGNSTLSSYIVTDNQNNQYASSGWKGPTINPGVKVAFDITIDGKGFVFGWGGLYTVRLATSQGDRYTFSASLGVNIQYVSLNTTMAAIVSISNTGPPSITFNAYTVQDQSGHWSNNTSWLGPTLTPGTMLSENIQIDGVSFTFQSGRTYTLHLFDTTGTEWTISFTP